MSKVILITGASSGLGKAMAKYLSNFNYRVYGTSRNPKKYSKTTDYELLSLDITQPDKFRKLIDDIIIKTGRIDVLINNAGLGITGPIEETDLVAIKSNFDTNFFGPLALSQVVIPHMRRQKSGLIINITSIGGYMGLPFRGIYSASKGALGVATEALRMEVKSHNINLVTLAPGDYATDIASRRHHSPLKESSPYYETYKLSLDTMNDHVDSGGNPHDVAKMVFKIIESSRTHVHYISGTFLQKFSIFLKKLLPDTLYEKILMNHYKL
jgi:short-subunit dehydrogenase